MLMQVDSGQEIRASVDKMDGSSARGRTNLKESRGTEELGRRAPANKAELCGRPDLVDRRDG